MANTKSARKAVRHSECRHMRNRAATSSMRTFVKKARTAIETGVETGAEDAVRQAIVALDKAAKKGLIHRNNAARRKSRLMRRLNALKAQ